MDEAARREWSRRRPQPEARAACVAPWVALELDPSGWVYACCANQLYPLGRIGRDRLRDLWGGPRSQVLRDALARWDLSVGCGSCSWHLHHGRMDPDAAVYDRYPSPSDEPAGPVAMTFALGNRCNLACEMCTPELSSTLRARAGLPHLASPYDDRFFEDLEPFLADLRYAKFLGGEPFLIPEHHRVWRMMDEVGGPDRIQVTTNGTVWNDRVEWLLDRFPVDVTVSMDGATAPTYESIRRGASFADVRTNVERFAAACRRSGTELRLCFCLMPSNAVELPGFLDWADSLAAPVSVNVVSDPGLALHDLDEASLRAVADGWSRARTGSTGGTNDEVWHTQRRQLTSVVDERARGVGPALRQGTATPVGFLDPPRRSDADGGDELPVEIERLGAWAAPGAQVGVLELGDRGEVVDVIEPHEGLGLTPAVVGTVATDLLGVIERVDGRRAWAIGDDRRDGGGWIRTVILASERPRRGGSGTVVRFVLVPGGDRGWVLLAAADRTYDAPPTAVELVARTGR